MTCLHPKSKLLLLLGYRSKIHVYLLLVMFELQSFQLGHFCDRQSSVTCGLWRRRFGWELRRWRRQPGPVTFGILREPLSGCGFNPGMLLLNPLL